MNEQKPSVGRIVHYRLGRNHQQAAIITRAWDSGRVNLTVFPEDGGTHSATFVEYEPEQDKPHTWCWPPRS